MAVTSNDNNGLDTNQAGVVSDILVGLRDQAKFRQDGRYIWLADSEKDPLAGDLDGAKRAGSFANLTTTGLWHEAEKIQRNLDNSLGNTEDLKNLAQGDSRYSDALASAEAAASAARTAGKGLKGIHERHMLERENNLLAIAETEQEIAAFPKRKQSFNFLGKFGVNVKDPEELAKAQAAAQERLAMLREEKGNLSARQRGEVFAIMDQQRKAVIFSKLSNAQGDLANTEGDPALVTEAEGVAVKVALYKQLAHTPTQSTQEMVADAGEYQRNVARGQEARESLRQQDLAGFVGTIENDIKGIYAKRIQEAKTRDPLNYEGAVANLNTERDSLIEKLEGRGENGALGDQVQLVHHRIQVSNLSVDRKNAIQEQLLLSAINYNGKPDQFAASFLNQNTPDLAPVSLAKLVSTATLANGDAVNPINVLKVDVSNTGMIATMVGGGKVTLANEQTVKAATKNGIDMQGVGNSNRTLYFGINADTGVGSDNNQLALFNTGGKDVAVSAIGGGGLVNTKSPEQLRLMANTVRGVVSAGEVDGRIEANAALVAGRLDRGAQKQDDSRARAMAWQEESRGEKQKRGHGLPAKPVRQRHASTIDPHSSDLRNVAAAFHRAVGGVVAGVDLQNAPPGMYAANAPATPTAATTGAIQKRQAEAAASPIIPA
ncbi:MAG: hypothetical protein KGI29_01850 [Pseudomonadota bacterium]|nr:hypothetical protein [Pseudomonadota bacterium]MDE3037628.1 hypothetical protein [Pseudomonadota bacterium]